MTVPLDENGGAKTRFYFGSAVVTARDGSGQERALGAVFKLSRGLHKVYSAALLRGASDGIKRLKNQ